MPKHYYDPKFDALTLYDSFKEEVLLLANKPMHLQVPQIDINSRGGSTQVATPPAVWFQKDVRQYTDRASEIYEKNKAKLRRSYLPAPYNPCVLVSEADVVRSAALWLLHPVVIALQSQFDNVGCYAEVTIDDCRCDALIKINGKVIVVMEYKNRGYIKRAEFLQGRRDGSIANRLNILDDLANLKKLREESAMDNNAMCLTKQAAAYSSKFGTRFVALFDWDALFLWHFAGKDFRIGGLAGKSTDGLYGLDNHARWAFGTLVEKRQDYRSALLGFIMEAYSNKMNAKFELPARPPFEPSRAEKEKARLKAEAERRRLMTDQQRANESVYGRRG